MKEELNNKKKLVKSQINTRVEQDNCLALFILPLNLKVWKSKLSSESD